MVVTRDDPREPRHPSPTGSLASSGSFGRGRGNITMTIPGSSNVPSTSMETRVSQMENSIRSLTDMMSTMMRRLEEVQHLNPNTNHFRNEGSDRPVPNLENPFPNPSNNIDRQDLGNRDDRVEEVDLSSGGFSVRARQVYKPIPVKDWGIVFAGDSKGLKVRNFLRDMEKMALTQKVPIDSTLSAMHLCLSGDALAWYRSCELFSNWTDFSRAISATFGCLDGDLSVRRRLEERRQRDGERVGVFLAEIYSLFRELEVPMDSCSQIQLIRRNLTPQIRDAILLMNFNTLKDLESAVTTVENNSLLAAPEPRSRNARVNEIEQVSVVANPSKPNNSQPFRKSNSSTQDGKNQRNNTSTASSSPRYPLCVNCFLGHHLVRDCTQPRRATVLCFGCGRENTIREKCPNCRGAGGDGSRS